MVTTSRAGTRDDKSVGAGVDNQGGMASDRPAAGGGGQPPQRPPVQVYLTTPVVYDFRSNRKKNKRRKKYSRGLKTVQRSEDGLTLAGRRLGSAVEDGFRSYRKRRNRSARRKKDGSLRDILPNSTGGFGRFLREASDAPYDVARKVNSRRFGKQIRDTVRFFTLPLFR
ncbi:MAG TPA: hypothetical protein VGC66_06910 [Pyrinomonadaceae bacterium]|jgi:hypothetical protein